jgi:hypothetical protein
MYRWTNYASYGLMFAASLTIGAIGCSKTDPAPAASQSAPAADAHGATDAVAEAFASLSQEDRAAAEKQKICPVSDEPLGSMGTPIKVTVKGRDVFLCCVGCTKPIEEDPDKYLAKLDN